jgi:hypothetical protein
VKRKEELTTELTENTEKRSEVVTTGKPEAIGE